jgi:hypothetical protein
MRIIKSTDKIGLAMFFDRDSDAKEEFDLFCENALKCDSMTYEIIEMSKEDFDKLPEAERS